MSTRTSPACTTATLTMPRAVHAGLQATWSGIFNNTSATLSASDVIQMCVVPTGAIILDIRVSGKAGVTANVFKVGDGGDDDRFGTITLSATSQFLRTNANTGHAYQYSLSDDAAVQYETIDLTLLTASSVTLTASIVMTVEYWMPPK